MVQFIPWFNDAASSFKYSTLSHRVENWRMEKKHDNVIYKQEQSHDE